MKTGSHLEFASYITSGSRNQSANFAKQHAVIGNLFGGLLDWNYRILFDILSSTVNVTSSRC